MSINCRLNFSHLLTKSGLKSKLKRIAEAEKEATPTPMLILATVVVTEATAMEVTPAAAPTPNIVIVAVSGEAILRLIKPLTVRRGITMVPKDLAILTNAVRRKRSTTWTWKQLWQKQFRKNSETTAAVLVIVDAAVRSLSIDAKTAAAAAVVAVVMIVMTAMNRMIGKALSQITI